MNVTAAYAREIKKIDESIKSLQERKLKLPLIAGVLDKNIAGLISKKKTLEDDLKAEVSMTDAYVENVLKRHNSIKIK